MWIKDNEIVLQRPPVGKYPTQEEVEELKNVYDFDENGLPVGNWFAEQHILKSYPLWKQSNITREGGSALATMTTFIDEVRAWSNQDPMADPWDGSLEKIK